MEDFLLEHAARYKTLVQKVKPPRRKANERQRENVNPAVSVVARIRPMLDEETSSGQAVAAFPAMSSSYRLDEVFGADSTAESVYEHIVQPLLPYSWEGKIGTLFAFGQTGSGKTFSISQLERLVAKSLFDGTLSGERQVHVSIFELAGNSAFDLLNSRAPFSILEDSLGNTQLIGIQECHIKSAPDLLALIDTSVSFRQEASTEKNNRSSRSHAICRIRIKNPAPDISEDGILYLIDLAGSEAARDIFHHTTDRMKETREINLSLSVLKDCIRGIADMDTSAVTGKTSKRPYIPFRQSLLTKVLKHMFDPSAKRSCRTAVIACINPSFLDTGATKNTLRYAEMLRSAQPTQKAAGYNPRVPTTWSNKDLRNFIKIQSGNPSILPAIVAPKESGAQILRLPVQEFIERCLRFGGVTEDDAKILHAKLWKLHMDSMPKRNEREAVVTC